jgi:hypothetical protein
MPILILTVMQLKSLLPMGRDAARRETVGEMLPITRQLD